MADLLAKQNFIALKRFYRRKKTYSIMIAKWLKCRVCDPYSPSSYPAWSFVVSDFFYLDIHFLSPNRNCFACLSSVQFFFYHIISIIIKIFIVNLCELPGVIFNLYNIWTFWPALESKLLLLGHNIQNFDRRIPGLVYINLN